MGRDLAKGTSSLGRNKIFKAMKKYDRELAIRK